MAETITIFKGTKTEQYTSLLPQLEALWLGESDPVANMANTAAALFQTFGHHWIGFYVVKSDQLVLGPFQGPVACTRISFGKGVCGSAWAEKKTLVVADVEAFPGHIACSALSKSEIVIPLFEKKSQEVIAVLDIDSEHLNHFDNTDAQWLEKMMEKLVSACDWA